MAFPNTIDAACAWYHCDEKDLVQLVCPACKQEYYTLVVGFQVRTPIGELCLDCVELLEGELHDRHEYGQEDCC